MILVCALLLEAIALAGINPGDPAPILAVVVAVVCVFSLRESAPAIAVALAYTLWGPPAGRPAVLGISPSTVAALLVVAPLSAAGLRRWARRQALRAERRARRSTARQITAERSRHTEFVHGLDALVWEMDPATGTTEFVNSFAQTRLGYPLTDWLSGPAFRTSIIVDEDRARVQQAERAVAETGRPQRVEYQLVARDGWHLWVHESICAVPAREGGPTLLRGVAIDISDRKQADNALAQEKERFRTLFQGVPIGLYRTAATGEFLAANPALLQMLGYANLDALRASRSEDFYADPLDRWRWQSAMAQAGGVRDFEVPCRRRDGTMIWVRDTARAVKDASGSLLYYEGVMENVTDRRRAEAAERLAQAKFRVLVEQSLVGIYIVQDERLVYVNPRFAEMFGYSAAEILALPSVGSLVAEEDRARVRGYLERRIFTDTGGPLGFRGRRKDGGPVEVEIHGSRTEYEGRTAVLGSLLDITSRKRAEEELVQTALHDALTGLPNRLMFLKRLDRALRQSREGPGRQFAVLFLDLNRFKIINDSLGHPIGDELLKLVALRLQRCLRPGDTVARFGGDEFALLLEDITESAEAIVVAERIQAELSSPVDLNGYEVYTGASIGIALSSAGYDRPDHVLRSADMAMYRAKSSGLARYEVFDRTMHAQALARLQLETDLRRAVERDEFLLEYQPIVSLETGRLHALEALVRWSHPDRGRIGPGEFVPLAEEMGLIVPIGRWVLRTACAHLREWQTRHPGASDLSISVNLSVKQILQPAIVAEFRAVLRDYPVTPGTLKVEVTESVLLENQAAATAVLADLRTLGVRVMLDDFGTGYSSLSYLHRLPLDALKIDRSFVAAMGENEGGAHLTRTIVNLAHNLGFEVVAEGVETEVQSSELRSLGCEYGQGFLYAAPLSARAVEDLLAEGRTFRDPGEATLSTALVLAPTG